MHSATRERRKTERRRAARPESIVISVETPKGAFRQVTGTVLELSDGGVSVVCDAPLFEGALATIAGRLEPHSQPGTRAVVVCWCIPQPGSGYRVGLSFEHPARRATGSEPCEDYYEVLQLSPKADQETIHRVFRILAQRYHPDNGVTGNEERFKELLAAYQVLSDPAKRAAFDVRRAFGNASRWRIFDSFEATQGVESEKRKRHGILALLYARRVAQPEQPHLTLRELEELLACPREHLEFSLWYLRENSLVGRTDNARYSITAKGVDEAEKCVLSVRVRDGWRAA